MSIETTERDAVSKLGEAIGYGRTMQLCEELWNESLKSKYGISGGAHSTGPCTALLVPCGCAGNCDWCCGSGRVTKRVAKAKGNKKKNKALEAGR